MLGDVFGQHVHAPVCPLRTLQCQTEMLFHRQEAQAIFGAVDELKSANIHVA
jgi:hypothetical protein